MRNLCLALAAALPLLATPSEVHAQFGVTIRLDDATRRAVEQLPHELERALLSALEKGLPLVDRSVRKYIEQVERAGHGLVSAVRCELVTGPTQEIKDEVSRGLSNLVPFTRKAKAQPIAEAKQDIEETRAEITGGMPARDLADRYGDLLYRVKQKYCQAGGVSSPSADLILQRATWVQDKLAVWAYVRDVCPTVRDCVSRRRELVTALVERNDPRDVRKADARDLLGAVKDPQGSGQGRFDTSLLDEHEAALWQLQNVEFALVGASNHRLKEAEKAFASAGERIDFAKRSRDRAGAGLSKHDTRQNGNATGEARRGLAATREAEQFLRTAAEHADRGSEATAGLGEELSQVTAGLQSVITRADELNKAIRERAQEAQRREFERRMPR